MDFFRRMFGNMKKYKDTIKFRTLKMNEKWNPMK